MTLRVLEIYPEVLDFLSVDLDMQKEGLNLALVELVIYVEMVVRSHCTSERGRL